MTLREVIKLTKSLVVQFSSIKWEKDVYGFAFLSALIGVYVDNNNFIRHFN